MSLSGLSEREAEASRQKYGLNERTIDINFAENIMRGVTSLSCKLFVIGAMLKIVALLLGLLEVTAPVTDVSGIFVFAGLALLCAALEAVISYISEKRTAEISAYAKQSRYTVLRGTKTECIEEKMLAVGDVVYISKGDVVPADGIVAEGQFVVDQSEFGMLEKLEKTTPPSSFYGSKAMGLKSAYSLYKGSVITSGSGAMKITATGDNTLLSDKSEFGARIHGEEFSGIIRAGGITGAVCAVAVMVVCAICGMSAGQTIGGILEGFSAASAVLAVSCLCGKNLIAEAVAAGAMKSLYAREVNISNPDVLTNMRDVKIIFADKSGAFSGEDCVVNGFVDGTGNQIERIEDVDEKIISLIKIAAVNTSDAQLENDGTVHGGIPSDRAILNFVKRVPGKIKTKKQAVAEKNGISGVTVNLDGKLVTFFSGNAEFILNKCSDSFSADGKKHKITNKDALIKLAATISLTGNDVVALAVCDSVIKNEKLPSGTYTLIGMLVVHDNVCKEAGEALEILENSGVKTIVLTSASRETVIYTLKKTGKKSKGVILNSEQLAKMSDDELKRRFSEIRAIVNAGASDKIRIVRTASELELKTCVIGTGQKDVNMIDETDVAIASSVCSSSIRRSADASAEKCGLSAAAELCQGAVRFVNTCKILVSARIICAVLLAAMSIISVIGW